MLTIFCPRPRGGGGGGRPGHDRGGGGSCGGAPVPGREGHEVPAQGESHTNININIYQSQYLSISISTNLKKNQYQCHYLPIAVDATDYCLKCKVF